MVLFFFIRYPTSSQYLLGTESIFQIWKHLVVIDGKCGRKKFRTKLKAKYHVHRTLDVMASQSPKVLKQKALYTPPSKRKDYKRKDIS